MKKLSVIFILSLFIVLPAFGDTSDVADDLWTNYGIDITGGGKQKPVTDEEFEKALDQMDAKVNKWKRWAEKRKLPRGENFSQSNETEVLNSQHGKDTSLPVISLPVDIKIGESILPVGHYQVEGEKNENSAVLNIYQAGHLLTKIPAIETNDDFEQEEILFTDWLPVEDNKIKIIYGSLDFNAYAIVEMAESYN